MGAERPVRGLDDDLIFHVSLLMNFLETNRCHLAEP
jgi:hypothetical protein